MIAKTDRRSISETPSLYGLMFPSRDYDRWSRICWDNAVVESFFSSLKKERIKKQIYKKRELALADVADYIVTFYNRTRRHGHLGGVSPEQFEAATKCGAGMSTES